MPRYTGKDLEADLVEQMPHRNIQLDTDEGTLEFRLTENKARIISGKTPDGKLVTIDLNDKSGLITVT